MSFTIHLEQGQDYQFHVKFDWPDVPDLLLDEPEPLGKSKGPNAARLLAAAVANCLTASLLFCMRKFKQEPGRLRTDVTATLARNERGRIRIARIDTGDPSERSRQTHRPFRSLHPAVRGFLRGHRRHPAGHPGARASGGR